MTRIALPALAPNGLLLAMLLAMLAGCAATRGPAGGAVGAEIELFVSQPGNSFARYHVDPDGTIRWGGGLDAKIGKYSWQGRLTADEAQRLVALVERRDRFRLAPVANNASGSGREWMIRYADDRYAYRHVVTGACPELAELRGILDEAASRRFSAELDRIAAPGGDR